MLFAMGIKPKELTMPNKKKSLVKKIKCRGDNCYSQNCLYEVKLNGEQFGKEGR